eukprot:SAG25_NODE_11941_length_291_cov_1.265625_1_plen_31_part_10
MEIGCDMEISLYSVTWKSGLGRPGLSKNTSS